MPMLSLSSTKAAASAASSSVRRELQSLLKVVSGAAAASAAASNDKGKGNEDDDHLHDDGESVNSSSSTSFPDDELEESARTTVSQRSTNTATRTPGNSNNHNNNSSNNKLGLQQATSTTAATPRSKPMYMSLLAAVCFTLLFATFSMFRNRNASVTTTSVTVSEKYPKSSQHAWLEDDHDDDESSHLDKVNDKVKNDKNKKNKKNKNDKKANKKESGESAAVVTVVTSLLLNSTQKDLLRQSVPAGYEKPDSYYSDTYQLRSKLAVQRKDTVRNQQWKEEQAALAAQWGSWTLQDPKQHSRPDLTELYANYPNRDVPWEQFPAATAWQRDSEYLSQFLPHGLDLVHRSMEAILTEYGHGWTDEPDRSFEERAAMMDLKYLDFVNGNGGIPRKGHPRNIVGYTTHESMKALAKRMLHAIVTEDTFTFVMGGHSSSAGHGNHFQQSYTHQAHVILEPVLARLGVTYISHNMGMGGLGTLHNALGAQSIYGPDLDVLMWDSGMTENYDAAQDLFARQGVLGGNRVPLIWGLGSSGAGGGLPKDYETQAHVGIGVIGNFWGAGQHALPMCTSQAQAETQVPWAAQYIICDSSILGLCRENAYHSTCWIDRTDIDGIQPQSGQGHETPGRAKWHPGDKFHRFQGRMIAYTILRAVQQALTTWNDAAPNNYMLPNDVWHLHDDYQQSKKAMAALNMGTAPCYGLGFSNRVCQIPLQARTEFTPRANPATTSIRSIMNPAMHIPQPIPNEYDPPDVFNPNLYPPDGVLDAIAVVENGVDYTPLHARKHMVEQEYQVLLLLQQQREQQQQQQQHEQEHEHGRLLEEHSATTTTTSDRSLAIQSPGNSGDHSIIAPGQGWSLQALAASDNCDGTVDSFCGRTGGCLLYGHNDGRNGLIFDGYSGWMKLTMTNVQYGLIMILLEDKNAESNPRTVDWTCENNATTCSTAATTVAAAAVEEESGRDRFLRGGLSSLQQAEQQGDSKAMVLVDAEDQEQQQGDRQLKWANAAGDGVRYCDNFRFEFALNNNSDKITSWNKDEFLSRASAVKSNMYVWTLLDDADYVSSVSSSNNKALESMEVAFRVTGCGRDTTFALTHVYWA